MVDLDVEAYIERADAGDLRAINALYDHAFHTRDDELRALADAALVKSDPRVELNAIDGTVLIEIPGGDCWLAGQERWVSLPTFHIARDPITNRQYQQFVTETGYEQSGHGHPTYLAHWSGETPPRELLDHPVVNISMLDALAYCRWAGLTLPSEWMWEKAAAGAGGRAHPWGGAPPTPQLARVMSESTSPVGQYRKVRTAFGCQDMIGNVSEWCLSAPLIDEDALGPDIESFNLDDPSRYDDVHAVIRGSAYLRRQASLMSCQHTRALSMGRRNHWVGFRPATLLASAESAASSWGELRSACHDTSMNDSALLAHIERVLATWPPGADVTSEVSEYLRAHLGRWSFASGETPPIAIQLAWLNGRGHRVFSALHPDIIAARPDYGLLDRCVAAFVERKSWIVWPMFADITASDKVFELYDYLLSHSHRSREGSVRDVRGQSSGPISLTEWRELVAKHRAQGDALPAAQIEFSDVRLAGVEAALPPVTLSGHGQTWRLSIATGARTTLPHWSAWTSRSILQLLIASSELARAAAVEIDLGLDFPSSARDDVEALWAIYSGWRGVGLTATSAR